VTSPPCFCLAVSVSGVICVSIFINKDVAFYFLRDVLFICEWKYRTNYVSRRAVRCLFALRDHSVRFGNTFRCDAGRAVGEAWKKNLVCGSPRAVVSCRILAGVSFGRDGLSDKARADH
jgi:hypothetical protein